MSHLVCLLLGHLWVRIYTYPLLQPRPLLRSCSRCGAYRPA
jgi:hypothetical protein